MRCLAVLGAGRIGRIHAVNLASLSGVFLKYIYDIDSSAAGELANRVGAQVCDVDNILADPAVEGVVICSPTSTHSDLIVKCAAANKHIFCEKPIDLSYERAVSVANIVESTGVRCMIGFQRRFDPTFNAARKRLDAGEIGVPEMLVITSRDPGAPPIDYIKKSGGIFRDMLIHDFDVFRWILCADGDEAVWLSATGSVLIDPSVGAAGDFDCAAVTIRTRKGRLCQINTTRRAAYGYDQRFEVLGSGGMLQCGNRMPTEVQLWNGHGIHRDKPEEFFLQRYAEAYRLEIEHFVRCLQSNEPFKTTVQDGVLAQKLADAATRSATSGCPITF